MATSYNYSSVDNKSIIDVSTNHPGLYFFKILRDGNVTRGKFEVLN